MFPELIITAAFIPPKEGESTADVLAFMKTLADSAHRA